MRLRRWAVVGCATWTTTLGTSCLNSNPIAPGTKVVSVGAAGFSPASISRQVGATVTWRWNTDGVPHNVTLENGMASPTQSSGQFSHRFGTTGVFRYRCTLHSTDFTSGMVGVVDITTTGYYAEAR